MADHIELVNAVIDLATPNSIASSGRRGHEQLFLKSADPNDKIQREKVEGFTHLFTTKDPFERMKLMTSWFPSKMNPGGVDEGFLRGWLKDVAEIMQWADVGDVKLLLGVTLEKVGKTEEVELDEDHKKANKLLDDLDKEFQPTLGRNG